MKTIYPTILAFLFCFSAFADNDPANDSFITADTITVNGSVTGTVIFGTDQFDYYKLETTEDGNLTITLTGSTSDWIYLDVFDADGTTSLASNTNLGTTGLTSTLSGLAAGTYYLRVGQLNNGTNAYTMGNTFDEELTPAENEPNDSSSLAITIPVNTSVTGHIGFRSNGGSIDLRDYYKIVTPADGNLNLTLTGTEASFLYLEVIDMDGITQLNGSNNAGTSGITLSVNGLAAGTYYIVVAAYNTTYYNGYILTDSLDEETVVNDSEPNDSAFTAITLGVNTIVTGHIGFRNNGGVLDQQDYYKIVTPADGNLNLTLIGTEASFLYLSVFDIDGATQLNASSNAGTTGVTLSVNGIAAGTYYIRVAAFNTTYYNGYTLSDSLVEEIPVNDIEQNDTVTTASIFVSNSTTSGHIGYRFNGGSMDTYDFWKLTTTAGGDITIDFTATQSAFVYLTLLDSTGINNVGSTLGTGNLTLTSLAQPAGIYYFTIAALNTPYYNGYSITNTVATGIADLQGYSESCKLFPNPAVDQCTFYVNFPSVISSCEIVIIDVTGKVCIRQNSILGNDNSISLPVNMLENGIYFVDLKTKDFVARQKLLIQR